MATNKVLGLQISLGSYRSFVEEIMLLSSRHESHYVCVANVHMLMEVNRRKPFASVVNDASLVTPDGKPLTWALKSLSGIRQDRVAGMDLLPDLLKEAARTTTSVFFYGGTQGMLDRTRNVMQQRYPGLQIAGMYSPPFHASSKTEEEMDVQRINDSGAGLVFVILGCPKQEEWMARMKGRINAVMIGVGGALPVLIGLQKRAPNWMQDAGLEWVFRLYQEPGRLFRRYLVTNTGFVILFFKAYMGNMFRRKIL
ncbi:MAG: glycosyltransferase [Chitinophagaceae bacterium]|nr:MAG: glycosyltransferase [Chitinophagaceae bacterium]